MKRIKIIGIILIGFLCSFCSDSKPENVTPTSQNPQNSKKTYLALGDSYTIGESVSPSERFPEILVKRLQEQDIAYDTPKIIARTGWTTGELIEAIKAENVQGNFNLVTLLIGVNNQYRGLSVEDYRKELKELLQTALAFASYNAGNVRVISIPDWGVSPFAEGRDLQQISREINAFNAVKKEETQKLNIPFVNITEITRSALNQEQYFALDGLHFSKEMHELWVNEILKTF